MEHERIAHVIGNGPSWKEFQRVEEDDFIMGCNIPPLKVDATFISDFKILYRVKEGVVNLDYPMVLMKKVDHWMKGELGKGNKNSKLPLLTVLDVYDESKCSFPFHSSGHYAAAWLAYKGYKRVHIWGCDSLSNQHINSLTDEIIAKFSKNDKNHQKSMALRWRDNWKIIETKFPETTFIFENCVDKIIPR